MVYLSFDIEEFDLPFESGSSIDFSEQIRISQEGTYKILMLLNKYNVKATFFCTANFAENSPNLIKEIALMGHEIASHGYFHSKFQTSHLLKSREVLENISGSKIKGFRMARMMPVNEEDIFLAGYSYNSSINPTFIPGRYNNLNISRNPFMLKNVLQVPTAVTKYLRLPLFWLAVHNFPFAFYKFLLKRCLHNTDVIAIYFHPWEFYNLKSIKEKYKLSPIITNNSGDILIKRLEELIKLVKLNNVDFKLMRDIKLID